MANPGTGNQVLAGTVSSPTPGANCPAGGTDTRCTATVTVAGLSLTKTASTATTTPGGVVRFTVVAWNSGQSAYVATSFTDSLGGVLDDAVYDANATATAGALSYSGGSSPGPGTSRSARASPSPTRCGCPTPTRATGR